jgi:tetratricopeptide (TPR) repeat protein
MMMPSLRSSVAVALVGIPTAMAKETRKTSLEEDGTSANSTYDVTGDSASALKQLKGDSSEDEYNRLLLSNLQNKSAKDLIQKLENWESKDQKNHRQAPAPSARKRKRNDWILTYNRALAMHASGDSKGSVEVCLEKLKPVILDYQKVPDEMLVVSCRMVFLLLEGIMALSVGSHAGIEKVDDLVSTDSVINWLDTLNFDKDPELKFLAALYRSRLGFTERDSAGKLLDANIRSSRKELKQAMEIFQHKLRPSGDTVSLGSASCSEEKSTQQQLSMSRILQGQNQAALSLKANAEQLKGNVKKSLILCGEAHTAVSSEDDSSYAAIHANNLSIVFETNGKRHLALHTIAKALRANPSTAGFARDGTARPNLTIKLLYNSATCAAQAQNFLSAYECMATCVQQSAAMSQRPRCWLRLVEACIGT